MNCSNRLLGNGYRFEWAIDSEVYVEDFGDVEPADVNHVESVTLLNPQGQQVDHLAGVFMPATIDDQRTVRRAIENDIASGHMEIPHV